MIAKKRFGNHKWVKITTYFTGEIRRQGWLVPFFLKTKPSSRVVNVNIKLVPLLGKLLAKHWIG